jgi:hypothetical protein
MTQPSSHGTASSGTARTQVTLSRTDASDVGQRQIYARVDDAPTRVLLFGDSHTQDVVPGVHQLRANNTLFWKRVEFTIQPGQQIDFVLINRAGAFGLGLLALLGVAPLSLVIERRTPGSISQTIETANVPEP